MKHSTPTQTTEVIQVPMQPPAQPEEGVLVIGTELAFYLVTGLVCGALGLFWREIDGLKAGDKALQALIHRKLHLIPQLSTDKKNQKLRTL
mgnify:FL=1